MVKLNERKPAADRCPALPLPQQRWYALIDQLQLAPQQARIVELILRNRGDKQIAAAMGIKVPTVRTYLRRTFDKLGVEDRMELVLKLFAITCDHETDVIAHDDIRYVDNADGARPVADAG